MRWVRFGSNLELLDSPRIILMRLSDQSAAIKHAICDNIRKNSYNYTDVVGVLIQMLTKLPSARGKCGFSNLLLRRGTSSLPI
nr:DAR GTPase 3, chloroplastic [Tanacetum cinerariifolium]